MTALDPDVVERMARAMHEVSGQPGVYGLIPWDRLMENHRDAYRQMVRAAVAAMPASPAEETLRRVEALAGLHAALAPQAGDVVERVAHELANHQGLRGPMDPERPDVWQNRCECGWDDGDEHPGWRERYRLHVAAAAVAAMPASPAEETLRRVEALAGLDLDPPEVEAALAPQAGEVGQ